MQLDGKRRVQCVTAFESDAADVLDVVPYQTILLAALKLLGQYWLRHGSLEGQGLPKWSFSPTRS